MNEHLPPAVVWDTRTHRVRSEVVGDEYELAVSLPEEYDGSDARYPVLYVLDPPAWLGLVVPVVRTHVREGLLPPLIVVGVGRPVERLADWWPQRSRDYSPRPLPGEPGSGHLEGFLQALRHELLPHIDARYRTQPDDRAVWGHSLGGACALYTLLTQPDLFRRVIATSPAVRLGDQTLVDLTLIAPAAGSDLAARVFVSVGSLDTAFVPSVTAFADALRARDHRGLQLEMVELAGYAHSSAGAPGFLAGIRSVFS